MTRTLIQWYPPAGGATISFTTGDGAVNRLFRVDGLEPVGISPVAIKSPNQPGDTVVDVVVPGRTVTLQGVIQVDNFTGSGTDEDRVWQARRALERSLSQQPTRLNQVYQPGRLRVTRPDQQPLEIDAIPISSMIDRTGRTNMLVPFDIEFYCPNPYWRETADTVIQFTAAGGFEWAIEFSLEMPSNNVEVEIDNTGSVDAPILATITGDVTTARLINLTYGETLEIEGNLPATKQWIVSTAFGDKRIDEKTIATGATVSAMSKLDLALASFWTLRPGLNVVKFEADVNTSGSAVLTYRERFSGM